MPGYSISETKNGLKTLTVINPVNGREIKLHSSYDPDREAERSVESFSRGRSSIIAVSGIGLGYHIKFLKKKHPDAKIIAIEFSRDITAACREIYPESLEGIEIINTEDDISGIFDTINLSGFRGISHYIHKPSYQINPEFYEDMIVSIKLQVSSRISDLLTRFEFEDKWIENIFKNLKHLSSSVNVSELFGKFKGYPGVIVSAGPSLSKNIKKLSHIRDRAVIVAVDTAFKVMDKHNIKPHMVLTLDAQKYSHKHFTGIDPEKTVLIADIVSCPSILSTYKGKRILSTTSKYYTDSDGNIARETTPLIDWFETKAGKFGDIQSGGSVATSAFDLLLNMGCDPIILVGQDLAYPGREYHCSGTYHNDDWLPGINRFSNLDTINQNVIRKRKIKYVPAYGGETTVISDFVFDLYRSWFEDSSGIVPARVVNATGGGSRINNTDELDIIDAVADNPERATPASILEQITEKFSGRDISGIIDALKEESRNIDEIIKLTSSGTRDHALTEKINLILENDDTNAILSPLMKKSRFYISRHVLDEDKGVDIIFNDLKIASRKIKRYIYSSGLVDTGTTTKL